MGKISTSPSTAPRAPHDDWRAQDDFSTLVRAQQIMADKPRHKAAKAHGQSMLAAHQSALQANSAATTKLNAQKA